MQKFQLPEQKSKFISTIQLIYGKIWVASVGCGLLVYDPVLYNVIAHWGKEERYQVYTFMELEETSKVLVFTHRGIFVFESELDSGAGGIFAPMHKFSLVEELNIGVVIPQCGNLKSSEVWAGSLSGRLLFVLSTVDYSVMETIPLPVTDKKRTVRHMKGLEVNDKAVLAIANKHLIHLFDVEERRCLSKRFDCQELCSHIEEMRGKNSSVF